MSDLQILLIIIGVLIIAAVLVFNWWQERRFHQQVKISFSGLRSDALLDRPKLDVGKQYMNKKFHKPIMIVLAITVICIGFNFKQLMLRPFFRGAIIENVIDPTSVIFRNERFSGFIINGFLMCGEFNAKNKLGAYTGFNRFIADSNYTILPIDSHRWSKKHDALSGLEFEMKLLGSLNEKNKADLENLKNYRGNLRNIHKNIYDLEKAYQDVNEEEFDIYWQAICVNQ